MVDTYPVLAMRPVFSKGIDEEPMSFSDLDIMTRFVVLFTDEDSPYYREKDFDVRMNICAAHLSVGPNLMKKIRTGLTFSFMLTEYLKLSNTPRFEAWLSIKMLFHDLAQEARTPSVLSDSSIAQRMALAEKLMSLSQSVLEADHLLFPDAKTAKLVAQTVTAPNYAEKFALR